MEVLRKILRQFETSRHVLYALGAYLVQVPLNTVHGGVLERQASRTGTRGSRGPSDREEGRLESSDVAAVVNSLRREREREIGGDYRKICESLRNRGDGRYGSISIVF